MESSEADIVRAARAGDPSAFREIFERYHRRAHAVALGITADRAAADDALQETFFRVWRRLEDFREDASLATWIYRIAVNAALDVLRRRRRQGEASIDDVPEPELADQEPDRPEARVYGAEIREHVLEALATLSPTHRGVLVLREIEGLSYEEIAEVLGCSRGTVMSRLHYGRKALRERLEVLRS